MKCLIFHANEKTFRDRGSGFVVVLWSFALVVKKRKTRRRKVKAETIPVEKENWKDKVPFKYIFNIFNISGLVCGLVYPIKSYNHDP